MDAEEAFRQFCDEKYLNNSSSHCFSKEKHDKIVKYLQDPDSCVEPKFKWWVKQKDFALVDQPHLGIETALVCRSKNGLQKKVVYVEEFFNIIKKIHGANGHFKAKKTFKAIDDDFAYLPRDAVEKFVSLCAVCQVNQRQKTTTTLKPIISESFMDRGQIDLINMATYEVNGYKYIAHYVDHFSKFHIVWPLKSRTAEEVAETIREKVFGYIGIPKTFQSDNGKEFVNSILEEMVKKWVSKDQTFIHGRPRHPQSQGLVERGNAIVEDHIGSRMQEWSRKHTEPAPWNMWLPEIMYELNTAWQESINMSPYEVVFGIRPPGLFPTMTGGIYEEEEIPEEILHFRVQKINDYTEGETPEGETPCSNDHEYVETNKRKRHTDARDVANTSIKKARHKMCEQYNSKKSVQQKDYEVGDYVTVGIPKQDRSKLDQKRLVGLVVEKKGGFKRIRTSHGVLANMYTNDNLQKFVGTASIPMEEWEQEKIIPLRTAAKAENGTAKYQGHGRCTCSFGCYDGRCPCFHSDEMCSENCHKDKTCDNTCIEKMTSKEDQVVVEASPLYAHVEMFIDNILSKEMTSSSYDMVLDFFKDLSVDALLVARRKLRLPVLKQTQLRCNQLGRYGDGYLSQIPVELFKDGYMAVTPLDQQTDVCGSLSLYKWGADIYCSRMRLEIFLYALDNMKTLEEMIVDPGREDLEDLILKETKVFLEPAISFGPVQYLVVSKALKHCIAVYAKEGLTKYGEEYSDVINLLELENLNNPSEDLYGVMVKRTPYGAIDNIRDVCGCEAFGLCLVKDEQAHGWICCSICQQWYHEICLSEHAEQYQGNRKFNCGCTKKRPYKTEHKEFYNDTEAVRLATRKINLKKLVQDITTGKKETWRQMNSKSKSSKQIMEGSNASTIFNFEVFQYLFDEIKQISPSSSNTDISLVILPEVAIDLIRFKERLNRLQAELFFDDFIQQRESEN